MSKGNLSLVVANFGEDYIEPPEYSYEYRYKCPHCKELGKTYDDYKLYVNSKTLKFNCFRCGWSGRLSSGEFIKVSSNTKLIDRLAEVSSKLDKRLVDEDEENKYLFPYYKIPKTSVLVNDRAVSYLLNRGVSINDMVKYSMRCADEDSPKSLIGRIVIPNKVIAETFTNMYVARTYINETPKYKNPYDSPKNYVIFNIHNIKDNCEQLIINEGVLTSIVAGDDSIATYGKNISNYQLDLIVSKNPKKVYVSWDNDAKSSGSRDPTQFKVLKLINKLLIRLPKSEIYWVQVPPGKDAVDIGRELYRNKYIANAILVNKESINLFSKINHLIE